MPGIEDLLSLEQVEAANSHEQKIETFLLIL